LARLACSYHGTRQSGLVKAIVRAYVVTIDIWPDNVAVALWRTFRPSQTSTIPLLTAQARGLEHDYTD